MACGCSGGWSYSGLPGQSWSCGYKTWTFWTSSSAYYYLNTYYSSSFMVISGLISLISCSSIIPVTMYYSLVGWTTFYSWSGCWLFWISWLTRWFFLLSTLIGISGFNKKALFDSSLRYCEGIIELAISMEKFGSVSFLKILIIYSRTKSIDFPSVFAWSIILLYFLFL